MDQDHDPLTNLRQLLDATDSTLDEPYPVHYLIVVLAFAARVLLSLPPLAMLIVRLLKDGPYTKHDEALVFAMALGNEALRASSDPKLARGSFDFADAMQALQDKKARVQAAYDLVMYASEHVIPKILDMLDDAKRNGEFSMSVHLSILDCTSLFVALYMNAYLHGGEMLLENGCLAEAAYVAGGALDETPGPMHYSPLMHRLLARAAYEMPAQAQTLRDAGIAALGEPN